MIEFKEIKHEYISIFLLKYSEFEIDLFFNLLNDEEKNKLNSFSSIKRKREFLAVRILKNHFLKNHIIKYNDIGAPFIGNNEFISISHTDNIVCIAYNNKHLIGVDIEFTRYNIQKIKSKFISNEDEKYFDLKSEYELTKLWSYKETLYKISNTKGIDFKNNLSIVKNNSEIIGIINSTYKYKLKSIDIENLIITFNISDREQ